MYIFLFLTLINTTKIYSYKIKNQEKSSNLEILSQGIKINSDTFTIYIGKVRLKDGRIINFPPIKFKRHISVYKINKFLDTLNQDTREDLFSGTIDEYREWKKKNMK